MESGFIVGLPNRLNWVPPKPSPSGAEYSEWLPMTPLYPGQGNYFVGPGHLPLTYRCVRCWIYWIGPVGDGGSDPPTSEASRS